MDDLLTSDGHQDAFDDFLRSPSMQPEFPPEMAGHGTVVWEDFDELNDPNPHPDDDCWISFNQHKELVGKDASFPSANDWKDDTPDQQHNVVVTVDKARRFVWKQAKTEIKMLRSTWKKPNPGFDVLSDSVFGITSKLAALLMRELGVSFSDCSCRFLAALFLASKLRCPATRLCDNSRVNTTDFLERSKFVGIVRLLASCARQGNRSTALWMEVETMAFNSLAHEPLINPSNLVDLLVALDDDKCHCSCSANSDVRGLKRCRHVKDNRLGFTARTAALPASGFPPLSITWEREQDTSTTTFVRMVKKMFGQRSGDGDPDLNNVTFASDRGCWTPHLLFTCLLPWGADVVGTVMRCFWCPFTCDKMDRAKKDKFDRTQVQMKGCEDAWCKTLSFPRAKIRATCCQSGAGTAVSLAMLSTHHSKTLDFNLAFPKDHKCYFDQRVGQTERNAKAFPCFAGSSDFTRLILACPVRPLTTARGDVAWFIFRQRSLTSSTVDRMARVRAAQMFPDHEHRRAYEIVFQHLGLERLLPDEEEEAESVQGDGSSEAESSYDDNVKNDDPSSD